MKKLSPWTFLAIGFAISVVAICMGLFGAFGRPGYTQNMETAQNFKVQGDALQTEIDKGRRANERREAAIEKVKQIGQEWQAIVVRKTPPASVERGGINVNVNRWQLTVDSARYRESLQSAVNRQVKRGGVTVVSGPRVPEPTQSASAILSEYYNYPGIKFPVSIFNLGQVTVRGTWDQIRANVQGWAEMPNFLATTDGLQVQGTSPNLTATYNLVLVAYVRTSGVSGVVPEGAAAGAAGAAPGVGAFGGAAPGAAAGGRQQQVGSR